ncbi:uncharacterized protein LOC111087745 [Limulus polyphemus]|uniref:Uncharacterized protein LOC111087745 n=1 Tax=Limulus polyphemus TaxID=6850 RepID=A0ABM1T5P1_LIMPO|nr:uncharacterized protein LOC111087745 [Limulus polyphemus]
MNIFSMDESTYLLKSSSETARRSMKTRRSVKCRRAVVFIATTCFAIIVIVLIATRPVSSSNSSTDDSPPKPSLPRVPLEKDVPYLSKEEKLALSGQNDSLLSTPELLGLMQLALIKGARDLQAKLLQQSVKQQKKQTQELRNPLKYQTRDTLDTNRTTPLNNRKGLNYWSSVEKMLKDLDIPFHGPYRSGGPEESAYTSSYIPQPIKRMLRNLNISHAGLFELGIHSFSYGTFQNVTNPFFFSSPVNTLLKRLSFAGNNTGIDIFIPEIVNCLLNNLALPIGENKMAVLERTANKALFRQILLGYSKVENSSHERNYTVIPNTKMSNYSQCIPKFVRHFLKDLGISIGKYNSSTNKRTYTEMSEKFLPKFVKDLLHDFGNTTHGKDEDGDTVSATSKNTGHALLQLVLSGYANQTIMNANSNQTQNAEPMPRWIRDFLDGLGIPYSESSVRENLTIFVNEPDLEMMQFVNDSLEDLGISDTNFDQTRIPRFIKDMMDELGISYSSSTAENSSEVLIKTLAILKLVALLIGPKTEQSRNKLNSKASKYSTDVLETLAGFKFLQKQPQQLQHKKLSGNLHNFMKNLSENEYDYEKKYSDSDQRGNGRKDTFYMEGTANLTGERRNNSNLAGKRGNNSTVDSSLFPSQFFVDESIRSTYHSQPQQKEQIEKPVRSFINDLNIFSQNREITQQTQSTISSKPAELPSKPQQPQGQLQQSQQHLLEFQQSQRQQQPSQPQQFEQPPQPENSHQSQEKDPNFVNLFSNGTEAYVKQPKKIKRSHQFSQLRQLELKRQHFLQPQQSQQQQQSKQPQQNPKEFVQRLLYEFVSNSRNPQNFRNTEIASTNPMMSSYVPHHVATTENISKKTAYPFNNNNIYFQG